MDAIGTAINPREAIGGNKPPSTIDHAKDAFAALSEFLAGMPVVQTEDEARAAKLQVDRAKAALDEMEADRDGQVRPLNETVKSINSTFKEARDPLERLLNEVKSRLAAYLAAEERRRLAEAEAKRVALEEAERLAREAEAREAEAKDNAAAGEFTDVGAAVAEADSAFNDYGRAAREAARAERDTKVKVGGGFGRSLSMRTRETLVVVDASKALRAITKAGPLPEKLADALLSAARDYRKVKGKLPEGIEATTERGL